MLSKSDEYDSVNECTQEISKSIKLHILWGWQNANKIYYETAITDDRLMLQKVTLLLL